MVESIKKPVAMNIIFIGNPGTGKSTTLNALITPDGTGKPKFKAGIAIGGGLTQVLQEYVDPVQNFRFIDTPGLSDVTIRKQAAEEIQKALQMNGLYKIYFVITLEAGRIRPDDKTTMKLVLEACKDIKSSYGIIINKIQKKVKAKIELPEEYEKFMALLNANLPHGTQKLFMSLHDSALDGEDGGKADLTPEFYAFLKDSPIIEIKAEKVDKIKFDDFETIKAELETKLTALMNDNAKLMETVRQNNEDMKKMAEQQAKSQEAFREQLEKMQKEHQTQMAEQQKRLEQQLADAKRSGSDTTEIMKAMMEMQSRNQEAMMKMAQQNKQPESSCFAYGSQIIKKIREDNRENLQPIEMINVGDEVLTYDEKGHLFWDTVVLIDENLDAQSAKVQMTEIVIEGLEETPLCLTQHHYVFVVENAGGDVRKQIPARDVKTGDYMITFDSSSFRDQGEKTNLIVRKVKSVENDRSANSPTKNIITAHTRTVLVNNILCSVHCEGDWGELYFKLGFFLWKYVSKDTPQLMFKFHKWMKYDILKKKSKNSR